MKKPLFSLVALLALTVAGIAWAGPSAVPAAEAPEPAAGTSGPSGETAAGEAVTLEDLFVDPIPVDGCCNAECWDAWEICVNGCDGDEACLESCGAKRSNCLNQC